MYWRCLKIFTIVGLRMRAMTIKQNCFINGSELERSWHYPGQKLNGNQSWFWKWDLSQMSHFCCQNRTFFASWLCRDGFQMFLGVGALWPCQPSVIWRLTNRRGCLGVQGHTEGLPEKSVRFFLRRKTIHFQDLQFLRVRSFCMLYFIIFL